MHTHSTPIAQVYLSKEADELVLRPGISPTRMKHASTRVLVVGGGVTGLTSAWVLLDAGYSVTVVSDRWASSQDRITSQIAGALWEWPPAVCGRHTNIISLNHSKRWCITSYRVFDRLHKMLPAEVHGVRMRTANFFFGKAIEEDEEQYRKMREIEAVKIRGFERDPTLITKHAISQTTDVVDAYKYESPVVDTDIYMAWLQSLVASKGCQFFTKHIAGDVFQREDEILGAYGGQILVNCSGLNSLELAADASVYPLRGSLIRVVNDGSRFPLVKEALVVAYNHAKQEEDGGIVFIVPRNDRTLILGGIAQPNQYKPDLTLSSPEIRRMRDRCNRFVPGLANAELDNVAPLVQGLRPCRGKGVRVERELRKKSDGSFSRIVHSYGHGGSGFTLSFGCAGDVLSLVQQIEGDVSPTNSGKM